HGDVVGLAVRARFAVVHEGDGLAAGDGGVFAGGLKDFGDGGADEVIAAGQLIAVAHGFHALRADRAERLEVGQVDAVGVDAVPVRVQAGGHGGAVHDGGGAVNRMVVCKEDAFLGE